MPHMREVKTCDRCRHFKRRCDLAKPSCTRCLQAGVRCSFDTPAAHRPSSAFHLSSLASTLLPPPMPAQQPRPAHSLPAPVLPSLPARVASVLPAHHHQHHPPHFVHDHASPSPPFITPNGPAAPPLVGSVVSADLPASPAREDPDLAATPTSSGILHGLISPTTSTESPEPSSSSSATVVPAAATPPPADASPASLAAPSADPALARPGPHQQRIVRKRKRNCLSCLRCRRLKVKCNKELPCGRCKASGNGRECYYSYNKGPNGGKFPCPTAPVPSSRDEMKPQMATWQVQHRVRGSSHWRELMTKVREPPRSDETEGGGDADVGRSVHAARHDVEEPGHDALTGSRSGAWPMPRAASRLPWPPPSRASAPTPAWPTFACPGTSPLAPPAPQSTTRATP